jgi:hypothetical protein
MVRAVDDADVRVRLEFQVRKPLDELQKIC